MSSTPHSMFDMSGKVAIVTGATRGIGKATALALAQSGARVVIASNEVEACAEVEAEFQAAGHAPRGVPCDVSKLEELESLVSDTLRHFGQIDVLVCNAGIEGPVGPIAAASDADYDRTMEINLKSSLRLTGLVIPHMAANGGGSVVLISSIAGLRGNKAIGIYSLSKAALVQLARNLAVEWGPKNIRVNAVSPGLTRTDFARTILENEDYLPRRLSLTPLRRAGEPDEIAGAVLFLASRAGGFVTGHNLVVDGGTTISDGN